MSHLVRLVEMPFYLFPIPQKLGQTMRKNYELKLICRFYKKHIYKRNIRSKHSLDKANNIN
jgi:hypothetical protein